MTANEAYEKYKHLDVVLENERYTDTFRSQMLYELWRAIKESRFYTPATEDDALAHGAVQTWHMSDDDYRAARHALARGTGTVPQACSDAGPIGGE